MNFFYENQNSNSFLVYKIEEDDKLDSFIYGMVANNKINGIIPGNLTQINSDKFLKYNVSSTVTLSQYFEGIVNKNRIINVFLSIVGAIIDSEDYMIDSSMFVLDKDYIFVDVSSAKASVICFPIVGYSSSVKPLDFFKSIIFSVQYDRTENSDYVAEIITFLNSSESFSLVKFKEMLHSLNAVKTQTVQKPKPVSQPVVQPAPQPVAQPAPQPVAQPVAQPVVQSAPQPKQVSSAQSIPVQKLPVQSPATPNPAPAGASAGFEIPGGKKKKEKAQKQTASDNQGEKMSLMHLLSNFSKENLEIYKAQKNADEEISQPAPVQIPDSKKDRKKGKKGDNQPKGNPIAGFAIPGQNNNSIPQQVNTYKPAQPQPAPQPVAQPAPQPVPQPVPQPAPQPTPQPVQQSSANFGATTALGAISGGTTVLGADPIAAAVNANKLNPRLIRSKTNETVYINKPVFRIGKEHSYVDYFIADNSAISRSHANIISKDEHFFVVDTNSTNHTYVNANMIQSNVETEIFDKDMIKLANEDFEFRIY